MRPVDKQIQSDATKGPASWGGARSVGNVAAGIDSAPSVPADDDNPQLMEAMQEYIAEVEAGRRPNRQEFIARHSDISRELSECLNGLAFVQSAAAQIPGAKGHSGEGVASVSSDLAAKPLGDFKLTRELGRGGMGVVYEAIQLSLGRRVAVKVLSLAAALDPRHLQRFKNEAQAAAQLHHTNIVPVYAVGCERSVHFYAMQLIEGQTLADVIRELRRLGGLAAFRAMPESPGPVSAQIANLSVLHSSKRSAFCRSVAQTALQAAEALEYAHKLGVVHRDIKPANLMLDARGNLWITDFGLAQFYATDSGLTQTGDVVGTYRYMSPEQASGRAVVLDQRTDIYSLGVTLYELVTLERAVVGETREELLRQLESNDPKPVRSIDKTIPVELETIITKAIAKDPSERYSSARALADDLKRFLADQPILARPPSVWDKAVKWTRRHKAVTLSAMVVLMLAAIGLLTSTVLIARAQRQTRIAYEQQRDLTAEANQQRSRAEASYKQARTAVDLFSRAAENMPNDPGYDEVRKEMLEQALGYYQGFLEQRKDDPAGGEGLNAARSHISSVLTELSAFSEFHRIQLRSMILTQSSVQAALHLNEDQITKVNQSFGWRGRGGPGGDRGGPGGPGGDRGGPGGPRDNGPSSKSQSPASAAALSKSIDDILKPDQSIRLREISRQVRGAGALGDPDVADALLLTPSQKEEIRTIQTESRAGQRGGPDGFRGPQGRGQDETMSKILAIFTDDQLQIWKALVGEPFTGQVFIGGGGRGGPPRGGPQ